MSGTGYRSIVLLALLLGAIGIGFGGGFLAGRRSVRPARGAEGAAARTAEVLWTYKFKPPATFAMPPEKPMFKFEFRRLRAAPADHLGLTVTNLTDLGRSLDITVYGYNDEGVRTGESSKFVEMRPTDKVPLEFILFSTDLSRRKATYFVVQVQSQR